MLLEAGRDTAAMFFLDKRLGALRERHLRAVLEGESPPDSFWAEGEAAVVEEVKRKFYSPEVQAAVRPDPLKAGAGQANGEGGEAGAGGGSEEASGAASGKQDRAYEGHSQKLVEKAIWLAHEKIKQIPFVGDPGFEDGS